MELIRDNVIIQWDELGEGLDGDFNEDDPEDLELLRFDAMATNLEAEGESYCTQMPVRAPEVMQAAALEFLMDELFDSISEYGSANRIAQRLSWLSPNNSDVIRGTLNKVGPQGVSALLGEIREIHPLYSVEYASSLIKGMNELEAASLKASDVAPFLEMESSYSAVLAEALLVRRPDLLSRDDLALLLGSEESATREAAIAAMHRIPSTSPEPRSVAALRKR